jgi:hypothetical protein
MLCQSGKQLPKMARRMCSIIWKSIVLCGAHVRYLHVTKKAASLYPDSTAILEEFFHIEGKDNLSSH